MLKWRPFRSTLTFARKLVLALASVCHFHRCSDHTDHSTAAAILSLASRPRMPVRSRQVPLQMLSPVHGWSIEALHLSYNNCSLDPPITLNIEFGSDNVTAEFMRIEKLNFKLRSGPIYAQ